jgi:hypothetical protein
MKKFFYQIIFAVILIGLLTACGTETPPISLSPVGHIVKQAILLQLQQTEQKLSDQLLASHPKLEITQIKIKQLEPFYLAQLATYHLQGTYTLNINLPEQKVTQKDNLFDIYLQRQKEGKTWRWLKKEVESEDTEPNWKSYLIH